MNSSGLRGKLFLGRGGGRVWKVIFVHIRSSISAWIESVYRKLTCPTLTEIANAIYVALLEPLQSYEPMESTAVALPLEENPEFLKVSPYRVYNNLKHLNKLKARGPDGLSNCLLKECRTPSAARK